MFLWLWQRWEIIKKPTNYCYTAAKNIFVANTHILVLSVSQWFFITLIWDGNRPDEEGGEQLSPIYTVDASSLLHSSFLSNFLLRSNWIICIINWFILFSFFFYFWTMTHSGTWKFKWYFLLLHYSQLFLALIFKIVSNTVFFACDVTFLGLETKI